MQPTPVADYACNTGENPLYHPAHNRVFWTDIPAGRLFRYDPVTGHHEPFYEGRPVGGFTVQANGNLLLFMDRGTVAEYSPTDQAFTRTIVDEIPDERETRFNDVIADPEGRVFCGTMPAPDRPGRLYRLDGDGSYRIVVDEVKCSNGMAFSDDLATMLYTDTGRKTIWRFDYDRASGELTNRRVFIETPADSGGPDGMTLDADGFLWSAKWGGYGVEKYSPEGKLVDKIEMPTTERVSSVSFGGPDYATMYLTTAGGHERDKAGEDAGKLFRVDGVARGRPEFESRIGL